MPRHASELENSPLFLTKKNNEAPVTSGMNYLAVEDGKQLEIMTSVNSPTMVNALMICDIYERVYGSKYVAGRGNQIKRLAEAREGRRAQQIIEIVEAGGKLPAEYYTGTSKPNFSPVSEGLQ